MKKRYLTIAVATLLILSTGMTSCIGSFSLTHKVLRWNKQASNKFVNELIFFAFWILPVYEVTAVADLLVVNSIEFWSGNNPIDTAEGSKVVDTPHGKYLLAWDKSGYTITEKDTGESFRLNYAPENQTWSIEKDGQEYELMTFVDDNHVIMPGADGSRVKVELSERGVLAYSGIATGASGFMASN